MPVHRPSIFSLEIVKSMYEKYKPRATSVKGWWLGKEKIDGVWTSLGATEICFSQEKQITNDSRLEKSLKVTILFP